MWRAGGCNRMADLGDMNILVFPQGSCHNCRILCYVEHQLFENYFSLLMWKTCNLAGMCKKIPSAAALSVPFNLPAFKARLCSCVAGNPICPVRAAEERSVLKCGKSTLYAWLLRVPTRHGSPGRKAAPALSRAPGSRAVGGSLGALSTAGRVRTKISYRWAVAAGRQFKVFISRSRVSEKETLF